MYLILLSSIFLSVLLSLIFGRPAFICVVSFLVALIFTMSSGNYWLEIFNSYVGSIPLLIIAFFEIIAVIYVYGMKR